MKARRPGPGRARLAALGVGLLCALSAFAHAARAEIPTFGIAKDTSLYLSPDVEVLADPERRGRATHLLSPEVRFAPPLGVTPNFGIDETRRWYRFALRNESPTEPLHLYLDVGYPKLDRVTLHHLQNGELVSEKTGATSRDRPIPFPTFLFRVTLEPGETRTFLLEVESTSVHSVSIHASGQDAFVERTRRTFLWQGVFYGLLFMLTARHAFAFFTTRSREDLWYVVQSVSAGLYVASILGALYGLRPDAVESNAIAPLYFIGFAVFSTGRFGVAYLAPRGWARHLVDGASAAVLLVTLCSALLSFSTVVLVLFAAMTFLGPILLGAAARRAYGGSRPAGLYLLAWAPVFALGWAFGLGALGLAPVFHLGAYLIGLALLWERLVVSAGLHLRVSEAIRSELRLREEALVAAEKRRRLELERQRGRRLESLGRLSGGIAHDFNNLLQAIGGYVHVLARKEALSETGKEYLEHVKQAIRRATDLTRKLLVLGRSGPSESDAVEVDATLAELEDLLTRVLPSDVTFTLELGAPGAAVACDRGQFELSITNLCLNARDAMPKGGAVTISTQVVRGEVRIVVEDTGQGIPKEHLEHIFEPFFTTKPAGEGTGLGLVMVYSMATAAGGRLAVESEVGVGSRFVLELPITEAPKRAPVGAPVELAPPRGGSERILFVDDAESVREVGVAILEDAGYDVSEAADGVEAIEVLHSSPAFDLVVMDVVMPRMGGAELYEWLERHRPGLPVLVCTAYRPEEAASRLDRAQLPLLRKPYEAEELLRAVRSLLDVKRGDEPAPPAPRPT